MQNGNPPCSLMFHLAKIRTHETEAVSMALEINTLQPQSKAHPLKNYHHQCSVKHWNHTQRFPVAGWKSSLEDDVDSNPISQRNKFCWTGQVI